MPHFVAAIGSSSAAGWRQLLDPVARLMPKLVAFVLVLGFGGLFAWGCGALVRSGLIRIGLTRICLTRIGLDGLARGEVDAHGPEPIRPAMDGQAEVSAGRSDDRRAGSTAAATAAGVAVATVRLGLMLASLRIALGVAGAGLAVAWLDAAVTWLTRIGAVLGLAVMAAATGILVVGIGGGLIRPMRTRWESLLLGTDGRAGDFVDGRNRIEGRGGVALPADMAGHLALTDPGDSAAAVVGAAVPTATSTPAGSPGTAGATGYRM